MAAGTEKVPYSQEEVTDPVTLVRRAVEDCENNYHDAFIGKVEKRYLAYRGLTQVPAGERSDDDSWRSEVTTPYVLQTCEGMLATMLEPNPRFDVKPRPKPDEPLDEVMQRIQAVDAVSDTLR